MQPLHVLEGALIAAHAVGANKVVVALKASFTTEVARVATAIEELQLAGWTGQLEVTLFEGPDAYLYGEETALLEALEGRPPFPRIAPPYRRGVSAVAADGVLSDSGLSARVHMAGAGADIDAVPALVDNVETLANVPKIVERGPAWFRTEGTEGSPGTVVCTVTGRVATPGVGEVLMGTTIREAIDQVGGGSLPGHEPVAVLPGVSGALIGVEHFDTAMTYEAMAAIGSGLGSAGFLVLDETSDPVAVVAGVSRFLAVESCGQCSPCKQDGLMLAELLEALASSRLPHAGLQRIRKRTTTVATGARCGLATQQQVVVDSLLRHFPTVVEAHAERSVAPVRPEVIAELVSIDGGGVVVDVGHAAKQPDWTFDADWSGSTPVELATDHSRLKQGR